MHTLLRLSSPGCSTSRCVLNSSPASLCASFSKRSIHGRSYLRTNPDTAQSVGASRKRSFHSSRRALAAQDPYKVLGVNKGASASDIKKKYYELARKHHPDTNKDPKSKDKFVEIQAAWDILSDDKKRAAFDQYGSASQQEGFDPNAFSRGNPFSGFGGFEGFSQSFGGGGGSGSMPNDLFSSLFGGGGRSRANEAGEDLQVRLSLSFVDACKGVKRKVDITPIVDCNRCEGSGLKSGRSRSTCGTCRGSGMTYVVISGMQMGSTCPTCQGSGNVVERDSECNSCGGVGKLKERKSVEVDIPAGVEDGMTVQVPGAGDRPLSGKGRPGDLLVTVDVSPSRVFRRQGMQLYHDVRIPLHSALLGGVVRVPTLDAEVDLKVPSGTQPGQEAVLKGRGVPNPRSSSKTLGDLIVRFNVQIPRYLTPRQKEILQQFADDLEGKVPAASTASESVPRQDTTTAPSTPTPETPQAEDSPSSDSSQSTPNSNRGGGGFLGWLKGKIGT